MRVDDLEDERCQPGALRDEMSGVTPADGFARDGGKGRHPTFALLKSPRDLGEIAELEVVESVSLPEPHLAASSDHGPLFTKRIRHCPDTRCSQSAEQIIVSGGTVETGPR
jgi:hypothetical protein